MQAFAVAHATHPQWEACAEIALAQLEQTAACAAGRRRLGLLYFTDHFAKQATDLIAHLQNRRADVAHWAGSVGVGICANQPSAVGSTAVEYIDEPAMVLMLCDLPEASFRVFAGTAPLGKTQAEGGFQPHTALVHADGQTPDLAELIAEFAVRTSSGQVFGGLAASRSTTVHVAAFPAEASGCQTSGPQTSGSQTSHAPTALSGGLSGVAFSEQAGVLARVTQGCQAIGQRRKVTACEGHLLKELDGEPALAVLLRDVGMAPGSVQGPISQAAVLKLRQTLVGIESTDAAAPRQLKSLAFSNQTRVRHIIGLDPSGGAVAVAEYLNLGDTVAFCERNVAAARADLRRICTELRAATEPDELAADLAASLSAASSGSEVITNNQSTSAKHCSASSPALTGMLGAIYVSCAGRGGPHFGAANAEAALVRHGLGDVPFIGFFAGGEIAHQQIHGYTGVLLVFSTDPQLQGSA